MARTSNAERHSSVVMRVGYGTAWTTTADGAHRPMIDRTAPVPRAPGARRGILRVPGRQRQTSLSVTVPVDVMKTVRLSPFSQVTVPSGFFLRYLYCTVVPGGSWWVPAHTG